jgi:geranylgeranyl diphosphate synthase type II
MPADFMQVLEQKKALVWPEFQRYLPKGKDMHSQLVRDYPERGGKYLRSGLVLLAAEAFGGNPSKAIRTAAAMEASQNWILIHDDIEDRSEDRRGKPTLFRIYGEEMAINAGDALHVIQWKMLLDNREMLDEKTAFRVLNEFYRILSLTTEGQTLELEWIQKKGVDISEADYYAISDAKAGMYTVIGPMRLGAIVAGAPDEQLAALNTFGLPFGRAFQIQDDVLNLTAGSAYGKEIGGDVYEGKRTLMLVHLLQHCTPAEKEKIIAVYRKKREQKRPEEVKFILDLMKSKGSIDFAKKRSLEWAAQAQKLFDSELRFLKDSPAKQTIRAGIEFVAKRPM